MPRGGLTSGSGYNGHNSDGRHKKRKPGNKLAGRPLGAKDSVPRKPEGADGPSPNTTPQPYARAEFEAFFTPERRREVMLELQKQAEGGHYKSQELLLNYWMGKPAVATEVSEAETMTAEEARAMWEQAKREGLHLVPRDEEAVEGEQEGESAR